MKLHRLSIERLPGIDQPFELDDLGSGLNIIVGPNGIGKSRICAAVRALLWHERGESNDRFTARAVFGHDDALWQVVRDGSLHRWQRDGIDATAPTLPGERLEACFFLGLRDLLDGSVRADLDLAGEIRLQMSGGFDLDAVNRHFQDSIPAKIGIKESKALSEADTEIRKAERSQIQILEREQELESLETRVQDARHARQRLPHYERAISLQTFRRDFTGRQAQLDELPEALAGFDGKEIERLDKLEENLGQKRRDQEAANNALGESREAARGSRLTEPIEAALLETWRSRTEKLGELERGLASARERAARARASANECRKALGSHAASDAHPLAIDDDFDLFAFLRESHRLTTQSIVLQERLELLSAPKAADDDAPQYAEQRGRGVESLRAWLRAPDPSAHASEATAWSSRTFFLIAAVAATTIGLGLQQLVPSFGIAIVGVGVGIGLALAGLLSGGRGQGSAAPDWRSIAEQQFPALIEAPASWSLDAVTARLRQLEEELAQHEAREKLENYRVIDRANLDQSLKTVDQQLDDLEARRQDLADRLGLDALRPDADLVDLARALDASRAAHAEAESATAAVDQLAEQQQALLQAISAFLSDRAEQSPGDAASARAGIDALKERSRVLASANADAIREERRRNQLDDEIEQLEVEKSNLFRITGIEANDRSGLTRRLDLLDRYRELSREQSELSTKIKLVHEELDQAGEAELAALDLPRLTEEKAELENQSQRQDELSRQIAEIELDARLAREGHVLEDSIAKRNAALSELRDRRDEALAAAAGKLLIEQVRREHEMNQMPRVLERARDHFGTFTHHRYELQVSAVGGGAFVAVDTKRGEGLGPDELSDGTRAQLILAARLAFAEEAELEADLPLFLDEAMDHSDPERFHAIARSLARMVVDGGRQVFYLSNDPTDVERFQSAFDEEGCDQLKTIDLGEIRGQAARADGPGALRVAPRPAVPSPEDQDPESYGTAIGVSRLDPSRDPFSQSLFYLLRDDLSLLHDLLQAGIKTVGQCRNLLKGRFDLAEKFATRSEVATQLEARIELLETFCLAWREGRGKKVRRVEIEASRSVSEKYLDAVTGIATKLDGDAGQLLTVLRERADPELRGFRKTSADEFERYCVEHGYIDEKPVLDENEIAVRAIETPAASRLSPKIAAELVRQWWSLSDHATTA